MSKPERYAYNRHTLEDKKKFDNGVRYEHWRDSIDNAHHIHLPDGMVIIFRHEDHEGDVEIKEATRVPIR